MLVITWIRKAYKVLSADASPSAIAFAAAFGLLAGMLPLGSGMSTFLLLLVLVIRLQLTTAIAFWFIGAGLRAGLVGQFIAVAERLHETEAQRAFWTWFLEQPIVPWLDLHYHAILGGTICGVAIGAIVFFPIRGLVIAYRRFAHEKVSENKFFRWLTGFWFTKVLRFVFVG